MDKCDFGLLIKICKQQNCNENSNGNEENLNGKG